MLVIPRGTTSELPTFGITNPVSWNSQLVGNFDLNRSELPTFRITVHISLNNNSTYFVLIKALFLMRGKLQITWDLNSPFVNLSLNFKI